MDSSNPLSLSFETNLLTGPNFYDWLRNLRIVLSSEKIDYVLDNLPVKEVPESASVEEKTAYNKWRGDDRKARCRMLTSMNTVLQKQHFNTESAYEMLLQLQKMYEELGVDRYSIYKKLVSMRMSVGSSVKDHVTEMISYIKQLEKFGPCMRERLAADLILQSLPESFSHFIDPDLFNGDCNLLELLDRLIIAETNMKNTECTLLDSSISSSLSNNQLAGKTKIKEAKPKLTSDIKNAHLKPKGDITKAHSKTKGGIKKAHLEPKESSDDWHKWEKPKLGWIKLNTDGCLKGYGGLFRDHEGKPLCAYVVRSAANDTFMTELLAVWRGISEAYVSGYTCLWVESDSHSVVRTINGEQSCPPMAARYLNEISRIKDYFKDFKITFSWRECNKAADHLSRMHDRIGEDLVRRWLLLTPDNFSETLCIIKKEELMLTPDDFPETLRTIIEDDAGGRLYYRRTSRT